MNKPTTVDNSQASREQVVCESQERVKTSGGGKAKRYGRVLLGQDVHAADVVVSRMIDGAVPQPRQRFKLAAYLDWVRKLVAASQEVISCYEAGPTGFALHRRMGALGVKNHVVAPVCLDDRRRGVNDDRRDARELVTRLDRHVAGNPRAMTVVRVPSPEEEQRRGLTRQREQFRQERVAVAAMGRSLLLTVGYRERNRWWQPRRWAVLQEQVPVWLECRLAAFRRILLALDAEVQALTAAVEKEAPVQLPKGMGRLTHEIVEREVVDWDRLSGWRSAGSYAGLTGGVSASGQQRTDLPITKAGNRRLRTILVELAWRMVIDQPEYYLVKKWKVLSSPSRATARQRKRAIVALARGLFVDLWRWKTGRRTPEQLGWRMVVAA
jgi:transposase